MLYEIEILQDICIRADCRDSAILSFRRGKFHFRHFHAVAVAVAAVHRVSGIFFTSERYLFMGQLSPKPILWYSPENSSVTLDGSYVVWDPRLRLYKS